MINNDRRCEVDSSSCNSQSKENEECSPSSGKCKRDASPKKVEVSVRIENGVPTGKNLKKVLADSNCIEEQKPASAPEEGETWKAGTAQNISGFNGTEVSEEQLEDDAILQNDDFEYEDRDQIAPYLPAETEVVPLERNDIQEDREIMRSYDKKFLSRSRITPVLRAALLDWLTEMQVFTGSDTTVLHIAALILDRYTWIYPVTTKQYILVAIAAFLAAANLTPRKLEIPVLIDVLLDFSNYLFKRMDLCNMNLELQEGFPTALMQAIPHRFLSNCMMAMHDLNRADDRRWFVALCLYCLDLGLLDWNLVKYPASMKCAAVVFLVRSILPNYCSCSHEALHDTNSRCPYHRIEPWTPELTSAIHYDDTPELRKAANIYLKLLNEAQRLINADTRESVPGCGPPFKSPQQRNLVVEKKAFTMAKKMNIQFRVHRS
ncbi:Cyclin-A3-4 [Taenia solium]|eukprot:TsM_001068300 transcript=TsM_001068300 gene=TsM_001068300